MSFALPSIKSKPEYSIDKPLDEGAYGVPELMKSGFATVKNTTDLHPLIQSEKNFVKSKHDMNMVILRNTQGLHAPLRIGMELKASRKIGHLPFLQSHGVMTDSLTGRDLEIGPEDIFNTPEFCEMAGQPHAMVEKAFGIL